MSLLRLAEETCLCQRHFERKFKQHTGLTPKEYSRIMKFKHAVDLLRSTSFDNLLSVAIKAGYYDVSHLSKEIKKMSGNAPSQLLTSAPLEEGTLSYVKT
ncbi:helix-turn-helix domain-containing protein [Bacteroides uniformis]|uniref:helix-turn-helix domain-containing protein n=1 Tax=Bacteroides uniformis TaxID=820 RepID=UPI001E5C2C08|nr:helix-turn-helix domain-containing protein [Bacteroides uniformis]